MKCFACKLTESSLTDSRALRAEGWHDVSSSVLPDDSPEQKRKTLGTDAFWLCPACVRDTVQCARCGLRTNAEAARTGRGFDAFVGVEVIVSPVWACTGESWEWLCGDCQQAN